MNYGGSQIICDGNAGRMGLAQLDFIGTMKGFESDKPEIVLYMSSYIYKNSALYDPFLVVYTLFDPLGNIVKNQGSQTASRFDTGIYYANYAWYSLNKIPALGTYRIVWEITDTEFSQTISRANTFSIYKSRSEVCQASDVAYGGSGTLDYTIKQSGTCNTQNYGIGNPTQISLSGCGCS